MQNKSKFFKLLVVELVLGALLLGGIFFNEIKDFFYNQNIKTTNTNCILNQNDCTTFIKDGSEVIASITPKEIYPLQKVNFNINAKDVKSIKLIANGINMDMGVHSFDMQKTSDNTFNASFLLPSCTIDMNWLVKAIIEKDSGIYAVIFELKSHK